MVPIAHASDGGGSIRIPASCCGVVGLKPSRGRVPFTVRRFEGWAGLTTHFAVTRSVRDAARLLDAVAGPEPGAPVLQAPAPGAFEAALRARHRPLRIARLRAPFSGTPVDPECERTIDLAAEACRKLGHTVGDATPKVDHRACTCCLRHGGRGEHPVGNLCPRGAARPRLHRGRCRAGDLLIAQSGREVDGLAYVAARDTFDQATRDMAAFHEDWDLLLSPVVAQPPVELGRLGLSPKDFRQYAADVTVFSPYASLANITGQPAISLPLRDDSAGLPSGAMFLARFGEEATLLSLSAALERELPWIGRRAQFRAG
jgi:Asp-tRNA(Asn)/Glu-tRNA(Gln) amidotransferase A subunit family amidase